MKKLFNRKSLAFLIGVPLLACCGLVMLGTLFAPAEEEPDRAGDAVEISAVEETAVSTDTPLPTDTPSPTDTPAPIRTRRPTRTPVPTNTPWPTDAPTDTPLPTAEATLPPAQPPTPVEARVVIIRVNKEAEYVDIQNSGGTDQDLGGWRLVSEKGPQECNLSGVLPSGGSLRIWAMAEDAGNGGFNCQFGTTIWNNQESDPAALYDAAGNLIDRR